jgi:hypothetical protein
MFITSKKILMVFSLLICLPINGMQEDPLKLLAAQLDRLPAEVSLEVARYYVRPMYQRRFLMGHPNGANGITTEVAVEKVRRFYELHPHCKKNNPLVTQILLGHIVDNFMIFRLAQFDQIIAGVQKPELMPIFSDPAMKAWVAMQQKRIAQEHELFREDTYKIESLVFGRNSAYSTYIHNNDKMKRLLALGVDVNAKDTRPGSYEGCTPLMLACKEGNLSVVDCLLKAGADVTLQDSQGRYAVEHLPPMNDELRYNAIFQLLLQAEP